jgi:hypothetical protein
MGFGKRDFFFALSICLAAPPAEAAALGPNGVVTNGYPSPSTPPNLVAPNAVPGGITLVPGTVVIPGVGGTTATGTVPLAGTVGSTGVGTFDPGLGMVPNAAGGALYPQASYPQIALPTTNQSVLPPPDPRTFGPGANGLQNVIPYGIPPSAANCSPGAPFGNPGC